MNTPKDKVVDHINGLKYDNRKSNLRICTYSDNSKNQKKRSNNTSGVTGVSWCEKDSCWVAQICVNGRTMYLGGFQEKSDAIKVRKKAEEKYFGEYSYDNSQKKGA